MATRTWNCVMRVMNVAGSTGNVLTPIRDKYASIPSHRTEGGVGGTGEAETKPNNMTFIRFDGLNSQIPKGSKIQSALLAWGVNSADWKTSVTFKIQGCGNFSSSLSGVNQPKTYGTVSEHTLPQRPVTQSYSFTADITPTIQYMIENNLFCVKIYTSPGKNRKYLSGNCTLTVIYTSVTGVPGISIQSTDCVSNSYAYETVNVQATRPSGVSSGDTVYYQYKIVSGSSTYTSKWTTSLTQALPIQGNKGSTNTITVSSSLFANGELPTSSSSVSVTRVTDPTLSFTVVSASNLVNNETYIVANGNISFRATATVVSAKKSFTPIIRFYVDNTLISSYSSGLTTTFSYNFTQNKYYSIYTEILDGFNTKKSSVLNVKGGSPILAQVSGDIIGVPKIACDRSIAVTAAAQSQDSGTTINSLVINLYKIENGVTSLLFTQSGSVSPQTLSYTIPSYVYTSPTVIYYVVITARNTLGQETTISTLSNPTTINRKPNYVTQFNVERLIPDIFGNRTPAQDIANGYSNFYNANDSTLMFNWSSVVDADINDIVKYRFSSSDLSIDLLETYYPYTYSFVGSNQSKTFSVYSKDDYNSTAAISRTIYGSNIITTAPNLNIECYEPYTGTGTPITINGNTLIDATQTYVPYNELTNIVRLTVNSISSNSTLQSHMRAVFEMWLGHDDSWKLIKSYTTESGIFNTFFQYDTQTDAVNKIKFKVYYLDRFNVPGTVMESDIYSVRQFLSVPQVKGTIGTGYRWLFGEMPVSAQRLQLNKPTFFCTVLNPNSANYTLQVELYNSNKSLLESLTDSGVNIKPNNILSSKMSDYIPSENLKAFRFTTELIPEQSYYIILKIMSGSSLIASSAFNENTMYIYSTSFEDKVWNNYWAVDKIIETDHINLLNRYLTKLYRSYGYKDPILFDVEKDQIIRATVDDEIQEKYPNVMDDPVVVEPTGTNLAPLFNQWIMDDTSKISGSNSIVLIDEENPVIESLFIPWNHRADQMKLDFTIVVNNDDYDKLLQLDVLFYDYYKNIIEEASQTSMLVTPSTAEVTYINGLELTYSNIYDSTTVDILSNGIQYVKIRISRYDSTGNLEDFSVKNVFVTSNPSASFSTYTTYDYSAVEYECGSKQTAYEQLKSEFLRLVNMIKTDVASTSISFPVVPTITEPNYILDSIITAEEDIENLAVNQNGIFGYLKTF